MDIVSACGDLGRSGIRCVSRLDREGWLDLGREALLDPAPDSLTLEALCRRAERTRGSFYHHFEGVPQFIDALAEHWEKAATLDVIADAEMHADGASRMQALDKLTRKLDPRLDQGFRRLALSHPSVQAVVRRVDKARIGYLERLHLMLDPHQPDRAARLARIEYAAFIGLQQLEEDSLGMDRDALYAQFIALVAGRGSST